MSEVISLANYQNTNIEKAFQDQTLGQAHTVINGIQRQLSEEDVCKAYDAWDLIKGIRGNEGEERTWAGKKYKKVGNKWKPVPKGGEKKQSKKELLAAFEKEYCAAKDDKAKDKVIDKYMDMDTEAFDSDDLNDIIDKYEEKERPQKKHSTEHLTKHAENTSTDQLKKVANDKKAERHVRDAAKRELERRSGEEAEGAKQDEDFKHNRLMAGYHEMMEQKFYEQQSDLKSSSDRSLHKVADQLEPHRKKHEVESAKHMAKARELHNPARHGDWNKTIPTEEEAKKYGEQALKKTKKK